MDINTLLLVEDEPLIRESVMRTLRRDQYDFLEAENGVAAFEALEKSHPDLILLDLQMPQMDGFAFLKKFRQNEANWTTPICVMTAGSELNDRRRAIDLGADDFILKPAEPVELRTRIQSLLRLGRANRELQSVNTNLEAIVGERTCELIEAIHELERSKQEIDQAYKETVLRLTLAAEMKDKCTSAHLERMSNFSVLLAEKAGWNSTDLEVMLEAAKMHDIGKIGIPDRILNKPGPLTDDEFEVIKQHPEIGARILAGSTARMLQIGAIIALSHHERYDGTGYPGGLAGEPIPEAGRIVAIADVFDALMSRRSYKEAWSLEDTIEAMRSESGRHFDPRLIELFLSDIPALLAIQDKFDDTGDTH
jgi:putative two-component system response regulator